MRDIEDSVGQYDVAVIGLGPAGSTLARLLSKKHAVLALDKKTPSGGGFQKPCGGLLAPDAQKSLARLGLTLPQGVLADPQIFSVRTIDVPTRRIRHYQRFYLNLNRHKFDLWLRSLIPESVAVRDNARCSAVKRLEDGFLITWQEDGREYRAKSKYIVGADGANSLVRRAIYPNHRIRTYLSIQQWFEDMHASPFYSCIFDPDSTDCYAWGLSKGGSFIFGGAFAPQKAKESFAKLKAKMERFGFSLGNPIRTEACLTLRPSGLLDFTCGRDGAFLIGEAAGFISPSSLEGISYALDSAIQLAGVLNRSPADPNSQYIRRTAKIRMKLFAKHLKSPFMYSAFLRGLVMRSGIGSISVSPGQERGEINNPPRSGGK